MDDELQRKCLADLSPEVCRCLRDVDGYSAVLFVEKGKELSSSDIARLLGYVDAQGKVLQDPKRTLMGKLEILVKARILVSRRNPRDKREYIYTLGGFAPAVLEQCRARSKELDQEISKGEKAIAETRRENNRLKGIRKRLPCSGSLP